MSPFADHLRSTMRESLTRAFAFSLRAQQCDRHGNTLAADSYRRMEADEMAAHHDTKRKLDKTASVDRRAAQYRD